MRATNLTTPASAGAGLLPVNSACPAARLAFQHEGCRGCLRLLGSMRCGVLYIMFCVPIGILWFCACGCLVQRFLRACRKTVRLRSLPIVTPGVIRTSFHQGTCIHSVIKKEPVQNSSIAHQHALELPQPAIISHRWQAPDLLL